MNDAAVADGRMVTISKQGAPAPLVRIFGWVSLAVLAAFMINNVLVVGFDYPPLSAAFTGGGSVLVPLVLYGIAILGSCLYVLRNSDTSLRWEARKISDFNIYLVRAFFFAVLFVGLVDATIAFMRVERFLEVFFDAETAGAFGRGQWVGPYIHTPLVLLGFIVALFSRTLGFTWLALLIVVAELLIVISRFLFSYEQALMGDLVRYWYAALFLFASAYTLLDEGHVRVDVFYAGFKTKTKGFVNAIGSLLLGMSTCWVIIAMGFGSKQSIINSPVANFEVTQTGGTGMFVKYQMAAFLGVFAITMLIQFVSYLFEAVADYREEPGHVDHEPVSH
ncbi:MAG: TRAP transporter small permease subunit [Ahrensia sp.]|nr:TRAP transporter small permease subunit [Ahrensia sp.]